MRQGTLFTHVINHAYNNNNNLDILNNITNFIISENRDEHFVLKMARVKVLLLACSNFEELSPSADYQRPF